MATQVKAGRRIKLTVFLIKEGLKKVEEFLDVAKLKSVSVSAKGTKGTLFYRGGFQSKPAWVSIFEEIPDFDSSKIINQSSRGLLAIQVSGRWFCFTFGYARQLIADDLMAFFGPLVT